MEDKIGSKEDGSGDIAAVGQQNHSHKAKRIISLN